MLNVKMTKTPDESGVQLRLSWKPEAETIKFTAEELVKQNYGSGIAMLTANALADLSMVVQSLRDFLKEKTGEEDAKMIENPKLLFETVPKDARMVKEDIRNADFY